MNIEIKAQGIYPKDTPPEGEKILVWSEYFESWSESTIDLRYGDFWVQLSTPEEHEVDKELARLVTAAHEANIDVKDLLIHAIKEA